MIADPEIPSNSLAAAVDEYQQYLAKRVLARLYFKTRRGELKSRDRLVWLSGIDSFKTSMCKKLRKGQTIPRLDDAKLTRCEEYVPYGCVGVKLVRLRANGTEGKLLALGKGARS